jgi:hypothetical protein
MKRAVVFFSAGLFSLLLFLSLVGCGDQNMAPTSKTDKMKPEVQSEVKPIVKAGTEMIEPVEEVPAPAAEEEEEDQFGC